MEITRSLSLAGGVSIAYRLLAGGDRGAIVLLHGLASNLTRWSEFVETTSLAQGWTLLRIDLRGHGDSVARGRVTLESWCDDLVAILEREGCASAVLVGHSLGAQVALHFAARFPARTRGLVLIDPVFRQALRGRWRLNAALGPVFALAAAIVRAANALGLQRARIEPLDLRELDQAARRALRDKASEREFIRRYSSTRADLRHFRTAHYLQELYEMFRLAPALDSLRLPVLVLLSSGGTFARAADMEPLLGRLPDAQTQRIDCHHWPLTEKPDEVRHAIERWCEALATSESLALIQSPPSSYRSMRMDGPIRSIPKDAYAALVGTEVGVSDWLRIEQSRIDAFAAATDDAHFIHVDPQRAAVTPLRGTVAHGYLTLSMLSRMAYEVCPSIDGARFPLNYGFNRLRFVAPVPSGARVRGRFLLKSFEHQAETRWVSTWDVTVEIEGGDKPALVGQWLTVAVF